MPPRIPHRPLLAYRPRILPSAQFSRHITSSQSLCAESAATADRPTPSTPTSQSSTTDSANDLFSVSSTMASTLAASQSAADAARRASMAESLAKVAELGKAADLEKYRHRRWRAGDVYAPHDLTSTEMTKWRKRQKPSTDAFDTLGVNPIDEYKNFALMADYMTEMGRIKHSNETGLRPVNQRRVARAIRRAIGIGLMPSIHKHPQLLELDAKRRGANSRHI